MNPITTHRLELVPATAELVRQEIENPMGFFGQLAVDSASDWPSENLADALPFFLEQLEDSPLMVGWLAWYWIHDMAEDSQLVGGGGFKGIPTNGIVEVGYETRIRFRRQGFATEAVGALGAWALTHPDVDVVIAETSTDNISSIRVLSKLEFVQVGPGSEVGLLRFERR